MSTAFPIKLVIDPATTPLVHRELTAIGSARQRAARLRMLAEMALRMEATQQTIRGSAPESHRIMGSEPSLVHPRAAKPFEGTAYTAPGVVQSLDLPTGSDYETDEIANQMATFY